MKTCRNIMFGLLGSVLALTSAIGISKVQENEEEKLIGEELQEVLTPANERVKKLGSPDIKRGAGDSEEEEEEEEIGDVNKVIIHYVNEANDCNGRAFYVWVNGIDGEEYNNDSPKDIMSYEEDGSMMTITLDMTEGKPFADFFGSPSLMFIIKFKKIDASNLNWNGQSDDIELRYSQFPPVDGVVEIWCAPAAGGGISLFATEEETKVDGVKLAKFSNFKTIKCNLTDTASTVEWKLYGFDESYYKLKPKKREAVKDNYLIKTGSNSEKEFLINFKYFAHINAVYCIESIDVNSTNGLKKIAYVGMDNLYSLPRFEKYYTYKGVDLGMTYSKEATLFKVWSPISANMTLMLYDTNTTSTYGGTDKAQGYHMFYAGYGVWELTVLGDLKGKFYNYQVDNYNGTNVVMDPYAHAAGANGLRSMVYDPKDVSVTPEHWNELPVNWDKTDYDITSSQELSVYEIHVQDLTGDESWVSNNGNKRGTYNAFVESGTTYTQDGKTVSTGFDHLKELGINAVQLMPVFDHDNDEVPDEDEEAKYNWGYNPLNYNCIEGAYSSDPTNALARIYEFKNMIYELSQAPEHIRVIMDVVYNHVSSASASNFHKLMPRYFFRYTPEGELYDGSGCHNEFKSEATMARKFIVDSVHWWASEYKVKGFRFDLMGLIDTNTMLAVKKDLYKVDPDIVLYGEGWTCNGFNGGYDYSTGLPSHGTFASGSGNQVYTELYSTHEQVVLGGFNETGRNSLRGGNDLGWGSTNHLPGYGYISQDKDHVGDGTRENVCGMIYGESKGIGANPAQTVGYSSCHDNWTLRDQLYYTLGVGVGAPSGYDVMHASEVCHAITFASNGIAFMLGGEELLRTKDLAYITNAEQKAKVLPNTYENMYGHLISHNSYNSPLEVNSFKWGNKISVTFDNGEKVNTYDEGGEGLTKVFANMIAVHKQMPKYSFHELYEEYDGREPITQKTSKGNPVLNTSWTADGGNKSGAAFQFDEYFIFSSSVDVASFTDANIGGWQQVFTAGTVKYSGSTLTLGDTTFGKGFAIAIYRRG